MTLQPNTGFKPPENGRLELTELLSRPAAAIPESMKGKCYNCMRYPPEGVSLKVCGKCKLSAYCSRECQLAAWTSHKSTCRLVVYDADGSSAVKKLSSWLASYKGTLQDFALKSLELQDYPLERKSTHLMVVHITERAQPPSKLQTFQLEEAYVQSWEEILCDHEDDPELHSYLMKLRAKAAANPFEVNYMVTATFLKAGGRSIRNLWYSMADTGASLQHEPRWVWAKCWKEVLATMMENGRQDIVAVKLRHYSTE